MPPAAEAEAEPALRNQRQTPACLVQTVRGPWLFAFDFAVWLEAKAAPMSVRDRKSVV